MDEFIDAIVQYFESQAELVSLLGHDPANEVFAIGYYVGDIPAQLPYLSVRVGKTRPASESNIQWNRTGILLTCHSTNPQLCSKVMDKVSKLGRPESVRGYMNISNDRISNLETSMGRRWPAEKLDKQMDNQSDMWSDSIEFELIWSDSACRTNPYDLPIETFELVDDRDVCGS